MSRRHCELKVKHDRLTIKDLGSRNGTIVDGKTVPPETRVPLEDGAVLQIGKYRLEVRWSQGHRRSHDLGSSTVPETSLDQVNLSSWFEDETAVRNEPTRSWSSPTTLPVPALPTEKDAAAEPAPATSQPGEQSIETQKADAAETVSGDPATIEEDPKLKEFREKLRGRTTAKDSQDAAQQALRKLFGRGIER